MSDTKIEWADKVWNPVVGCSITSPGCTNCYAMRMAGRLEAMGHAAYQGLTTRAKTGFVWTGKVALNEKALLEPLRWKKPARIFVNSMGDLFHESVPDEWIDRVFAVMALCPQHQFLILTKRADRMREYVRNFRWTRVLESCREPTRGGGSIITKWSIHSLAQAFGLTATKFSDIRNHSTFPLPNVWLGVSVENQQAAEDRIPHLLATPAAVRWISAEPLLGPVDLREVCNGHYFQNPLTGHRWHDAPEGVPSVNDNGGAKLDWVVCGGESGKDARPMHPDWARSLRDQCAAAAVPFNFKQWGEWAPDKFLSNMRAEEEESAEFIRGETCHDFDDGVEAWRAGKKRAGRLLDGALHDAFPVAHP